MYNQLDLRQILFFDIECVSGYPTLAEVPDALAAVWRQKAPRILRVEELSEEEVEASYPERAGIYAEFGRIVCISVGIVTGEAGEEELRVKSFANADERALLGAFAELLTKNPTLRYFCGHNIKEFDVPYVGRRMLVHRMTLPPTLDLRGKKPWDTKHLLDTMEMWSFGDRRNFVSLKLLAALFDIPSPKDDIDGSDVGRVFYADEGSGEPSGLERIAVYCEKDVVATTNVFLALTGRTAIPAERVAIVSRPAAPEVPAAPPAETPPAQP